MVHKTARSSAFREYLAISNGGSPGRLSAPPFEAGFLQSGIVSGFSADRPRFDSPWMFWNDIVYYFEDRGSIDLQQPLIGSHARAGEEIPIVRNS